MYSKGIVGAGHAVREDTRKQVRLVWSCPDEWYCDYEALGVESVIDGGDVEEVPKFEGHGNEAAGVVRVTSRVA